MSVSILRRFWPSTYACLAVLALSVALPLPQGGKILGVPSPCGFQHLFHLPCPACGLTRAFVATAHGHLSEAFHWHPLGPLLFGLTFAFALWSLWVSATNTPVRVSVRWQVGTGVALGLLLMVFWGLRLAGYFPLALT